MSSQSPNPKSQFLSLKGLDLGWPNQSLKDLAVNKISKFNYETEFSTEIEHWIVNKHCSENLNLEVLKKCILTQKF